MTEKYKPASLLMFLLANAAFAGAGCRGDRAVATGAAGAAPGGPMLPLVEALQARSGTLPLELRVSGVARAHNQVEIRPEISAVLVESLVASGDQVVKGQPLARLEPDPQQHDLRQGQATVRLAEAEAASARARLAELEAGASRTRKLAEQRMVSELERETQDAQVSAAEAAVKQALARVEEARASLGRRRSTLDKTVVRAPIGGRVGRREAEQGMLVTPATVLFVVGDLDRMIVDVPLTEKMLGQVRPGQTVTLRGPGLGAKPVAAKLSRISPFLAPGSFTTTGEIDVDNGDGRLLPGMFVTADIAVGESQPTTLVPTSALWEDPRTGLIGIYVVAGAGGDPGPDAVKARLRPVEIRAEGRTIVGVTGVAAGDWVVTLGQHLLSAAAGTGPDAGKARVRKASWDRVLELQSRQQEDLLAAFLEKQQRLARAHGAAPPPTSAMVEPADRPAAGTGPAPPPAAPAADRR
jgi:HlyD family secretion protein